MKYTVECRHNNKSCNDIYIMRDQNGGCYLGKKYRKRVLYKNEVGILKKVRHPNIVNLVANDDEKQFAVFEYIYGKTLSSVMRQNKQNKHRVLKHIIIQLIDVLQYLHSKNIIYCDLKPDNIIVNDSKMTLIDFDRSLNLDSWGNYGYSLDYASAETQSAMPLQSSDVWSLGIIMYEMFTGKTPFEKYNSADTKKAIKLGHINFAYIKDRDTDLFDLLTQMLVADPTKRLSLDEVRAHVYFKTS